MLAALLRDYRSLSTKSSGISKKRYDTWRTTYVFDALKNQRYGQAFCNRFKITDNILFFDTDSDFCHRYIMKNYIHNDKK